MCHHLAPQTYELCSKSMLGTLSIIGLNVSRTLPPAPAPYVLSRAEGGSSGNFIVVKFHDYGQPCDVQAVHSILELAQMFAYTEDPKKPLDPEIPMHFEEPHRMRMDLYPSFETEMTWGQWRLVLDCLFEFVEKWRMVNLSFEVREIGYVIRGKKLGEGLISNYLG
ncbi:hypothetical protein ACLMJK_004327 [Lecanora helva]